MKESAIHMFMIDADREHGCIENTYDCHECKEHWINYADADEDDACPNCGVENSPTQSVKEPQKPLSWG